MKTYTIQLSEADDLAFNVVAIDPAEWINNAVRVRVESAIDEIVTIAVKKYLEVGEQIPSTRDDIIYDAIERGWIKTAQEAHLEALSAGV